MKKLTASIIGVAFALSATLPLPAAGLGEKGAGTPGENAAEAPKVPLADPFIMLYGDTYYAYGTGDEEGIPVYTSKDLVTWSRAEGAAKGGLALHKDDVWGDRWLTQENRQEHNVPAGRHRNIASCGLF